MCIIIQRLLREHAVLIIIWIFRLEYCIINNQRIFFFYNQANSNRTLLSVARQHLAESDKVSVCAFNTQIAIECSENILYVIVDKKEISLIMHWYLLVKLVIEFWYAVQFSDSKNILIKSENYNLLGTSILWNIIFAICIGILWEFFQLLLEYLKYYSNRIEYYETNIIRWFLYIIYEYFRIVPKLFS